MGGAAGEAGRRFQLDCRAFEEDQAEPGGRLTVQDRGLAAYIAELLGTLFLTFFVTSVVVLYVASGQNAQFGSDFAVVGLTHAFVLFGLIASIGIASGGHFNPAVTLAFIGLRRIDPIDGPVYILRSEEPTC